MEIDFLLLFVYYTIFFEVMIYFWLVRLIPTVVNEIFNISISPFGNETEREFRYSTRNISGIRRKLDWKGHIVSGI